MSGNLTGNGVKHPGGRDRVRAGPGGGATRDAERYQGEDTV